MSLNPPREYQLTGADKEQEVTLVAATLAPVYRTLADVAAHLATLPEPMTKVVTSGFYNPIHKNHISNLISSKQLPTALLTAWQLPAAIHLTVVVNGDQSCRDKLGGVEFLTAVERAEVVRAIRGVDAVFIHETAEPHQAAVIGSGLFDVFTKGGDRDWASLPTVEQDALRASHTILVSNVGFTKYEGTADEVSSSVMRNRLRSG